MVLKELFVGKSLEGVKTFLRCCYQPQRVGQILEQAMEEEPLGRLVRDAWRVAHLTKSEQLCADMVAFISSRVDALRHPLIPWMEAAEECEAQVSQSVWRLLSRHINKLHPLPKTAMISYHSLCWSCILPIT